MVFDQGVGERNSLGDMVADMVGADEVGDICMFEDFSDGRYDTR